MLLNTNREPKANFFSFITIKLMGKRKTEK